MLLTWPCHPPAQWVGACRGHQQQEQPGAAVPFLPGHGVRFSKACRFCSAACAALPSPDNVPGVVWGVHRGGLAVSGLFVKAHFLGGAGY